MIFRRTNHETHRECSEGSVTQRCRLRVVMCPVYVLSPFHVLFIRPHPLRRYSSRTLVGAFARLLFSSLACSLILFPRVLLVLPYGFSSYISSSVSLCICSLMRVLSMRILLCAFSYAHSLMRVFLCAFSYACSLMSVLLCAFSCAHSLVCVLL